MCGFSLGFSEKEGYLSSSWIQAGSLAEDQLHRSTFPSASAVCCSGTGTQEKGSRGGESSLLTCFFLLLL